ncbi:MAG: transcription elongation factor GreA [Clostridia bacterium]|nr:transcription elongation factor GreA [Clostridia bacterium]
MAQKQYKMTAEGKASLEKELEELKTVKRQEVKEKIKVARSFGDLSENSEYDEAKNEQAIVESRIATLEAMLKNVVVIDESSISNETISIGSKVSLLNVTKSIEVNYHIVGSTEADPFNGAISDESPVGRSLLGHGIGDEVDVETPAGITVYRVLGIDR